MNTPTKIQPTPLSKRSTGSLLLTFVAALIAAIVLLFGVAVERTNAQAQGELWAWGDNGRGQLGTGTPCVCDTPVQVSSLSGVQADIDAGSSSQPSATGRRYGLGLGNNQLLEVMLTA